MSNIIVILGSLLLLGTVSGQSGDSLLGSLGFGSGTHEASGGLNAALNGEASGATGGLSGVLSGTAGGATGGLSGALSGATGSHAGLPGQTGGLFGHSGLLGSGGRFSSSGLLGGAGMSSFVSSGANKLRDTLGSLHTGVNTGLDLAAKGVSKGASSATQSLSTAIDASKQLVNTVAELKGAALSNSMDLANQAMDLADQISSTIPGLGPVVGIKTSIGRQATGAIKSTGLSVLGQLQTQANQNLDSLNSAAQSAGGSLTDTAHAGLSLASSGVDMGAGVSGTTIDTSERIVQGIISALENSGTGLSGTEGALTSTLQAATSSLPSQVTATFTNLPDTFITAGGIN